MFFFVMDVKRTFSLHIMGYNTHILDEKTTDKG
jgi:hypothetical protein